MSQTSEVPLHFDRIDIVRAPGFETRGFQVTDLSPGVTIIHGPNAAGKSTVARSLHHLLWPTGTDGRSSLVGQFSLDGESWRVEVNGTRVDYQLDGQPVARPNLPPADQRDRYFLALDRFLQDDTTDGTFAQAIKRESAGGYDLAEAYEALEFDDSASTRRLKVVDRAGSAVAGWREAAGELAKLEAEQERLTPLRQELAEARRARERVALLDKAIGYAEARDELEAKATALESFPDVLAEMDGSEARTVDGLDARIDDREGEIDEAEATLEAAEADLDEADLPDGGLPGGFVSRLKNRLDELSALESRKQDRIANLEGAKDRRARAIEDAPFEADSEAITDFERVAWNEFAGFIEAVEAVRSERKTLDAIERWLDDGEPADHELSALQRGAQCLERWLGEASGDVAVNVTMASLAVLVGGLSIGGTGVALAVLVHPAFGLLLLVAVWMLWTAVGLYRAAGSLDSDREAHRKAYERLGIGPPESWSDDGVSVRLNGIYDSIAKHKLAEERDGLRDALEPDMEALEEREAALEAKRDELFDQFGVTLDVTDVELAVFVDAVTRWQECHDEVVALEGTIDAIEEELEAVRTAIDGDLEPYGYEPVEDAAAAAQHINDLEDRGRTYDVAIQAVDQATETIERAAEKIEELESERDAVFTDVGLEADDGDRLQALCDQFEAYDDARSEWNDATLLLENAEKALESQPDFEPELEARSVVELETSKRDAQATADRYDELHAEITAIETTVREAKREDDLETALADKGRALDALEDQLHADYRSMVGHVLVEHLRGGSAAASQSEVLGGARDIFATITNGRYRLDVDDRNESFRAFDTVEERGYDLDELSSGTRLQLLLSVRVAFVEHQEPGVKLPLILDEALANTDDGKAEIVIDSMLELARDGRQVVYLSAQGDEVAKWLRALEEADDIDHAVIDLAEVRELDDRVTVPDLEELAVEPVSPPDLDGHDHASFGDALAVPAFDPRRGTGHAHLWYLVDDLELLCRLLELGIDCWGQFDTLADRTGHEVLADDPAAIEQVRQNGMALEEFVRCWQQGRGSLVTREALEESGAVSGTFIDEVTDLAADLDGDAERLIEALRDGAVNRFRSGKTDELEAYFEAEGYINPAESLDADQIRTRVAAAYVQQGVEREEAVERSNELLARIAVS